jgi:serine/threonine protein phosphatase PrpC
MLTMASSALTHPGLVRQSNEDNMLVAERMAAVADGLGGHAAGEVASEIAVTRLRELAETAGIHPDDVIAAIADINRLILERVAENPGTAGMGTTLCGVGVVVLDGVEHCVVFNVGDSRVYRFVNSVLDQVSVDHSEVQELQDAGQISAEAAAYYPRRNIITRCLGTDPAPTADVWIFVPSAQERFLICSDGLTGEVSDPAIAEALIQFSEAGDAAAALLQQALDSGGRDNVTIIVVDMVNDAPDALIVDELGPGSDSDTDPAAGDPPVT